jgi:hypothetical protein
VNLKGTPGVSQADGRRTEIGEGCALELDVGGVDYRLREAEALVGEQVGEDACRGSGDVVLGLSDHGERW